MLMNAGLHAGLYFTDGFGITTMDMFDTFIIAVGVALLLVGLYLFVSGKQGDGSRNSNLEGFGIKINVSNPSIILIVIGVFLILLPKFLPNAPEIDPGPGPIPVPGPGPTPGPIDPVVPEQPAVYFPKGDWYLTGFTQNGIDLTSAMTATASFSPNSKEAITWRMDFVTADMWGNMSQFFYAGRISHQNNSYTISVTQTNDPSLGGEVSSGLIMNMEDNGQLHLEYTIGFNKFITHWGQ